jgi:PAS domain S-box-containing protein
VTTRDDEDTLLRSVALQNATAILIARQRAEQRSEFYLAEGQRLAHMGSWAFNPSGFFDYWSPELFRICGLDPARGAPTLDEYLGRVHADDRGLMTGTLQQMRLGCSGCDVAHRIVRAGGEFRHLRWVGVPLVEEGVFKGFVGTAVDVTEQHEARAALEKAFDEIKESERRLQLVVDTIPTMVWSTLPDGSLDLINRPWVKYLGHTLEDLRRQGWDPVLHPEDAAETADKWRAALAAGKPYEHETRVRQADGAYRWFLVRAAPLRDERGDIVRWYGTTTDIEDRKRAEMLLAGEKRLLEMIARGESRALILDSLCRLVEELASGSLSSILLLDAKANQLRHGAAPSLPIPYSKAIDGLVIGPSVGSCGTAASRAEQVIVADIATDPLWADYRDLALAHGLRACWSTPILSSGRAVLGTFATYYREPRHPTAEEHNIIDRFTQIASIALERELAEQALRRQANLLEQTHDAILVWRLPGTIVYWNHGAELLYGFSRAEAIGRTSHDLLRTEHPMPAESLETLIERDGTWTGELTHRTRDGRRVVVDSRHVLVREAGGGRLVLETNRDITEQTVASEALGEAQAQLAHVTRVTTLGEVTASLAHEVNQPLAAIVNNANACLGLLPKGRDLDEVREALADIVSDGDRASAIIERVRGLAKRSTPQKVPLRLADVVADVLALAAAESTTRRVAIRTDLGPDLPMVLGDRVQLQQVLLNLVVNGMDAMSAVAEGERLLEIRGRLDSQDGSPAALLSVRDRGVGLEVGQVDSVFEAFYTTKPHGMGMGLAISRSIIEAHGGRLWVESNHDPGATFAFSLPAAEATREIPLPQVSPR